MSVIDNHAYPTVFPNTLAPEAEPAAASFGSAAPAYAGAPNDAIRPIFRFPQPQPQPVQPQPPAPPGWGNPSDGSGGLFGFANIMNGFLGALQTLMAKLAQQFGLGGTGMPSGDPQTYVANGTAASVGDPHDSFNATSAGGQKIGSKWDNMQSHGDLLDSDSFAGGYTVSTTATKPGGNGVTMNGSANVALDGGATDFTMNANGSFSVSSEGQKIQLQQGQRVQLADGATVTLGSDNALTVADTSASGGTLSTRLASNGQGGVDVSATANNVDLGGYLVNHNDAPSFPPPIEPFPITPEPLQPMQPVFDPNSFSSWDAPSSLGTDNQTIERA